MMSWKICGSSCRGFGLEGMNHGQNIRAMYLGMRRIDECEGISLN